MWVRYIGYVRYELVNDIERSDIEKARVIADKVSFLKQI